MLSVVVMLVVTIIGYLSGSLVAGPLGRLRRALEDAAGHGFALRISHRRRDEFGATFDAFNRAADAVEPQLSGADGDAADRAVQATRIARSSRLAA